MSKTCSVVGIWDQIVGEVHSEEVIAENHRRVSTGLSEFVEQIQEPLDFGESSSKGAILASVELLLTVFCLVHFHDTRFKLKKMQKLVVNLQSSGSEAQSESEKMSLWRRY
ncbi:hypothetical protein PIB30_072224 [Stylosanthes scabra]|uniref:Uncharacterized protein n=1 Tax=Stylosanthes scabra TaxID=79078 RepID=A0ABU6YMV1_9FABA|nr:hypothetical protein [Stylosanthes scabra]